MVGIGPMPGSTPISVPSRQPSSAEAEIVERQRGAEPGRQILQDVELHQRPHQAGSGCVSP